MIFEIKHDGRRKARLIAGGHMVTIHNMSARSTVVIGISVRILDIIAYRYNLTTLFGDIGNAFVTAPCLEKVYSVAGPEFGSEKTLQWLSKRLCMDFKVPAVPSACSLQNSCGVVVLNLQDMIGMFGSDYVIPRMGTIIFVPTWMTLK